MQQRRAHYTAVRRILSIFAARRGGFLTFGRLFRVDIPAGGNYNIIMEQLSFEWDENKDAINRRKHKISFEEAQSVFYDEAALLIDDPEHSEEEDRFIILGLSKRANLLVVCHCYRASESIIRIISARKATRTESQQYYR